MTSATLDAEIAAATEPSTLKEHACDSPDGGAGWPSSGRLLSPPLIQTG
jgi:hypothetical protein